MTLAYAIIVPTLAVVVDPRLPWHRQSALVQDGSERLNEGRCKQVCKESVHNVLTEIVDNETTECIFFCDCSWWADRGGFYNHEIREIESRHDFSNDVCEEGTTTPTEINEWVQGECQDVSLEGTDKVHIQTAIVPALERTEAWITKEGCKAFCIGQTARATAAGAEPKKTIIAAQYNPHRPRDQYKCNCLTSDVVKASSAVVKAFQRPHEPNARCMLLPENVTSGVPIPATTPTPPPADSTEPLNAEVRVKGYTPGDRNSSVFWLGKKVQGLTLKHISGSISCGGKQHEKCEYDAWGSYKRDDGKSYRNIILVNVSNETQEKHEAVDWEVGMYGGRADEKEMHFKGPFEAGKYLVSYREDWAYDQRTDNRGESVFKVFEKECADKENLPEEDVENDYDTEVTRCLVKYQAKYDLSGGYWNQVKYNECQKNKYYCTDKTTPEIHDCCPKLCNSCPY